MAKEAGSAADTKKYPLNLPDTPFPMRGNLPKREPEWIRKVWSSIWILSVMVCRLMVD